MATAARASPPARRTPVTSTSPTPPTARGATARSAASPRVSSSLAPAAARRASLKAAPTEPRDALTASLKQETDQKEHLLVQVQNKDETITTLSTENANLTSALHAAETRINELYTDQSRSELDLAQRIEISENLRSQVRELEKEKRDIQRRYNEQTTTFEAERQAFYDNEQHLKSRIMSLTQARRQPDRHVDVSSLTADTESIVDVEEEENPPQEAEPKQDMDDPETEPAEMTSLRLELSTLSTSHSSLQSTLVLLQTQLVDLKRVNHELQEENESYMILLRERTLSGQFNVMHQVGGGSSDGETEDEDEEDERASADVGSLRSAGRSVLDKVEEEEDGQEVETLEQQLERSLSSPRETDSPSSMRPPRSGRKRTGSQSHSPSVRGESLADLPITGPGLDLAAELGRAENKDILDGNVVDDQDHSVLNSKKRSKKGSSGRKDFDASGGLEPSGSLNDVDALRSEVKSLKDANKALSLYASKIIDRIISQEGFEHVLAVDYEKEPQTPRTPSTAVPMTRTLPAVLPLVKPRPQSAIVARTGSSTPGTPALNTSNSFLPSSPKVGSPPTAKVQRRSLSFDWKSFSLFSGDKKPAENPNLRPLTLKPGAGVTSNARKLETHEDENDRRERERMNATMKLMGIQPQPSPVFPPSIPTPPAPASVPATPSRRFSFFGRAPAATPPESSDTSSVHSNGSGGRIGLGIGLGAPGLTQEVLEHAEAENSLAALDAHERTLSAEIAKGSTGAFTEIAPRRARARRSQGGSRSGSANGSTVWSAGEDDEE
ncbi:hypothetical protein DFH08DRAFT_379577 [Mycena albidolilacea]|uniref:Uncharacterized protein n=1 Tax=Mycena albidolilacea TaxID=1033008 RepID=A0AAD7AL38_9AGAR|nr:hypothetical protein DFH08DRAFT_379577 [Mycena albidolilacea]